MSRYTLKHLNHSCSFSLLQTTITTADQRWVSIHLLDMKSLPDSAEKNFEKYWVLQKTSNRFSAIPFDQAREQN